MKTGFAATVAMLLLCCFSFQPLFAQQCNIATPSGTNVNLFLGANGNVTLNSNVFIPYVSSPNCPGGSIEIWFDILATVPFPPTNYDCSNVGNVVPVFVTIEGPFSQSNAVLFNVTIVDNLPPLVAWPANVNAPADPAACARAVNSLTPIVTDNCPGSYVVTWTRTGATPGSGSGSANGVYNVGVTQVNFSIDDLNTPGPVNGTHTTTVVITDSQAPTITPSSLPNQVHIANASCQASVTWNGGFHPVASDNCSLMFPASLLYTIQMSGATFLAPTSLPTVGPPTAFAPYTFNQGVTTVTYTAFDGINTTTLTFTVTVNDTTAPSFGAAPTVSTVAAVNCSAPVNINLTPFITDNCTIAANIVKTFTVTSASSGNSPYPLNVPQNGANVNATFLAGVYTIVFKATDGSNNMQTHTLTLSVLENTAPIAACQNFTAYLGANGTVTVNAQSLNNGSTDNCAVTVYEMFIGAGPLWVTSQNFNCAQIGNFSALFRVKDAAGNTSTNCGPVTITIADNMPPVAQCKNISVNLDQVGNTQHSIVATDINNMSYDNCTPMGSLTFEISEVFGGPYGASVVFDCSDVTTNVNPAEIVYLRVTDASLNVSNICSAQVTVNDVTPPTALCQNIAVSLTANGTASITANNVNNGSSDNCSFTLSVSPSTFNCTNLGANTVTLTATDIDGNTATCTATVTVQDLTPPTLVCPASPINVYLDANGNVNVPASLVGAGSTDNCTITLYEIRKVAINPAGFGPWASSQTYNCDDVGLHTVRLRVQDQSGNPNPIGTGILCNNAINVVDNIAPVAICNSVSVALGSNGQVTIPALSVSLGSTDNCYSVIFPTCILTREISTNGGNTYGPTALFTCGNLGSNNLVHVRITDCHGNDAVCTTNVTIQDNEAPVVTAPADITIECTASINPTVNLSLGTATATDNCTATAFVPPFTDVVTGCLPTGKDDYSYLEIR
ncbi:MAG: hypothetical protein IPM82_06015 [Saprospiraceae bacterium]|nr:hypothetical protein [Saprospiraceae bacterium]